MNTLKIKYFVRLAYDGTKYHGWQYQPNAITVQEVVEASLQTLMGEKIAVMGCGRTDSGVHASDFYLHCELPENKCENIDVVYKLNRLLPQDISIKSMHKVTQDAHTRFNATKREYRYYIHQAKSPFINKYSYFFLRELNFDKMRQAGLTLKDFTDFTSFSKLHTDTNTNDCKIFEFEINSLQDGRIEIVIAADRFLRNMVRSIVGTLLDVGTGKTTYDQFIDIVNSKNRCDAGASAPAKGLFLSRVDYPKNLFG